MKKERYNISGMTCSACSARVEKSVSALNGVADVSVNLLKNSMTLSYDESLIDASAIINAVGKAGYGASLISEKRSRISNDSNDEYLSLKKRVIASAIFEIPLFYLAMGHMMGWPLPSIFLGAENALMFAFTQFLLLLPILFINFKYFKNGFKTLVHLSPTMDSLISIGSGTAVIYGIYAIYRIAFGLGHGDNATAHHFMMNLYFESAGMILTLITFGKTLEARAKRRTSDAISKLINLAPKTATVERNGIEELISVDELCVGDILIVRAGEAVPADGVIIDGSATIDESALTGESIPAEKQIGDTVIGATISRSGYFKMRADKVGEDTALAQIVRLVDDATASKAPIAKLADKISGVFVPSVIGVSIISTVVWLIVGYGVEFALSIGISVLVISCPCALGLATPTAIMVGMGKGASNGILIKSAESLERAHSINTVVLDKTGTITKGEPEVTDVVTAEGVDLNELISLAASIEKLSEHPLALAIVRKAEDFRAELLAVSNFEQIPGGGIAGNINGKALIGGNRRLIEQYGLSSELLEVGNALSESGKTPLYFAYDNNVIGIIAVADTVKESSKMAVEALTDVGIDVVMLTGDNLQTAKAVASSVGISQVIAEVYPEDKEKEIRKLQTGGKAVAMVGDGINDAPALARADVGIAIGAGTDIAIESADIVLMRSDLIDVSRAIHLSRLTMRNIKQNLFWAFIYNVIGIPIAAGAFYIPFAIKLDPMIAGAAMSLSSVFVVGNALRLRAVKLKSKAKNNDAVIDSQTVQIKTIHIEGMSCMHCVAHAKKALLDIDGVVEAEVDLSSKSAAVTVNKNIKDAVFKKAIDNAGYSVTKID